MLDQLRIKNIEYDQILGRIETADFQLFKYIKQHGVLVRHPKEDLLTGEMARNYNEARKIQDEKMLIANTALISIAKHAEKFQHDVRRLVETGAIDHWDVKDDDDDFELVDTSLANPPTSAATSANPHATATPPAASDRQSVEVSEITKRMNNSSLDLKSQKNPKKSLRDKTPVQEDSSNTRETPPARRREVTAGPALIKTPNRRALGALSGVDGVKENGGNGDDDELYCFCQQVSYGAMVACDNPNCNYEWFHYNCVGLKEPPVGVWYCPECRKDVKKDTKKEKKQKV